VTRRSVDASYAPIVHFLRYLLASWAANAVVLGIVTAAFDDVRADTFGDLVVAAAVFGVLNTILKPILRLVTLPIAVVTLGLVWFGISLLMLWLTSVIVSGFDISGFWTYVWATVAVWAVNVLLELVEHHWRKSHRAQAAAAH
jgi:putative membrane protein